MLVAAGYAQFCVRTDVVMVSEIRDSETANLAIVTALTGHFNVFDVAYKLGSGYFARLLDMGVGHFY